MSRAILLHILLSTAFALVGSLVWGHLTPFIAVVSLVAGTVCSWFFWRRYKELRGGLSLQGWGEWVIAIFILFAAYRHFLYLFYVSGTTWHTLSLNNTGDLPWHLNLIRAFAQGVSFPPLNPIFSVETLRYPYGMDLYNALWECLGIPTSAHLFIVGWALTWVCLAELKRWGSLWAMGGFFLSGGLGILLLLQGHSLSQLDQQMDWKNFFTTIWLTQRGFLLALPLGLYLISSFRTWLISAQPWSRGMQIVWGLSWGWLAFFHLHSFMAVSLYMFCLGLPELRVRWRELQWALPIAIGIGSIFVLQSTQFFKAVGVLWFSPFWGAKADNWLWYTVLNLTPAFGLLMIFAWGWRRRWLPPYAQREAVVTGSLFALCFLHVMFAPWHWDNVKILIWPYMGFLYLFQRFIVVHWNRFAHLVAALVLFLSGTLSVCYSLTFQAPVGLYSLAEVARSEGALKGLPLSARFLAAMTYDHILTYHGRLRVLGYEGHLWSHGLPYAASKQLLETVMKGQQGWEKAARDLQATHLFWGPHERVAFAESLQPWKGKWRLIANVAGYEIYEIN